MIIEAANHLWQSTVLVTGVAVVSLLLRGASAQTRHRLWFVASMKFLLPFAPLIAMGGAINNATLHDSQNVVPAIEKVVADGLPIAETFAAATMPFTVPMAGEMEQPTFHWDELVVAMWGLGTMVVALVWLVRWRKLSAIYRSAQPVEWNLPIPVKLSPTLMEPGLVGFWRPTLLVPGRLSEQLSAEELQAVITHELSHWRRRDNFTAAAHMLVEALFWFHPMVWWIGARLSAAREQACDEDVIAAGEDRAVYAESILKTCRFYVRAPLACVSGMAGGSLAARIQTIMITALPRRLGISRRLALVVCGAAACGVPLMAGMAVPLVPTAIAAVPIEPIAVEKWTPEISDTGLAEPVAMASVLPEIRGASSETLTQTRSQLLPDLDYAVPRRIMEAVVRRPPAVTPATEVATVNSVSTENSTSSPSEPGLVRKVDQSQNAAVALSTPLTPEKYVGSYQIGPYGVYTVRLHGDHLFIRYRKDPEVPIHPVTATRAILSYQVHDGLRQIPVSRIDFDIDLTGAVTGFTLGGEFHARRIDQAAVDRLRSEAGYHIDRQRPTAGSEDMLKRHIATLVNGQLDITDLSARVVADLAPQVSVLAQNIAKLGSVQSITFAGVDDWGDDIYNVVFDRGGKWHCTIGFSAGGRISRLDWIRGAFPYDEGRDKAVGLRVFSVPSDPP